eukprot:TRINITY_DN2765_c0_g1_i1.p2 TRINITY_DN2765_c0_g1~~TRINITY_DN2765_c0_g1_i1.p2  ORF type:complete len:136 (-),score=13.50 TRINITY_DN2765_c0_g1_i1:69-476(-)
MCIRDSDTFNQYALTQMLQLFEQIKVGKLMQAFNGQQALDLFQENNEKENENNIKVILMDCQMPIMNGFDACLKIKTLILEKNYIPCLIIANTAHLDDNIIEKCQKHKFDDCFQKDYTKDQIEKRILDYFTQPNQ